MSTFVWLATRAPPAVPRALSASSTWTARPRTAEVSVTTPPAGPFGSPRPSGHADNYI